MKREIKNVLVLGSGLMGSGIAHVSALGGYDVMLFDISEAILLHGLEIIRTNMKKGVDKGKISKEEMELAISRIKVSNDLNSVGKIDMVIEAVPEDFNIKAEIYKKINQICDQETIIASNTSALSVTELASVTKYPDRFIGMHFFNPVHMMKLIEIIKGLETSKETLEVAIEFSRRINKESVLVNEFPGFVTTRINALIGNEAFKILEQGVASPADIDKAIKLGLNHPMGPFEMVDLVGLDTRLHILEYLSSTLGDRFKPSPLHVQYVKAGRLGKKAGKGIYNYDKSNL